MDNFLFNIDEIDPEQLDLYSATQHHDVYITMHYYMYDNKKITNEILSWILNPPPRHVPMEILHIVAVKRRALADEKVYLENYESSLHITRMVQENFYELMDSEVYKNESNISDLITRISEVIANKIDNVIEIEKIASLVTFIILSSRNIS